MGPRAILCLLLCLQPALAEVVNSFTGKCDGFFYKSVEPSLFQSNSHVKLCQEWHADDNYRRVARFPTLYDTSNRIPVWSAYFLATNSKGQHAKPVASWYVEAQLAGNNLGTAMSKEQAIDDQYEAELKRTQAINADYEDSDFDRGHLFPNSYQDTNNRLSTFTLTNAVPMDPCFNRVTWAKLERSLKSQLLAHCVNLGGIPYLVTGSVPDKSRKIPIRDPEANPPLPTQNTERVSVPSHMWTTVCCDHTDEAKKFTLAFLGENKAEGTLEPVTVEDLQNRLKNLYGSTQNLKIFADTCGSSDKNKEPVKGIVATIEKETVGGNVKLDRALERKRAADLIAQQSGSSQKVAKASDTSFALQFSSVADWLKSYNTASGFSCMLLSTGKIAHLFAHHDELRKRDVDSQLKGPVCLVQEATLPIPALGGKCVNDACSQKGYSYSWCKTDYDWGYCCTEQCLYSSSASRFECQTAGHGKVPCSPPYYSSVTLTGGTCRGDHSCARYKEDYYWCYTDYDNKWEFCCAPTDPCGSKSANSCGVFDNSFITKKCFA